MFSRTTMASSISRPMHKDKAINVTALMVKPNAYIAMKVDSTEIGIATVKDLNNFSPFAKDEKKKSGMSQKILIALVVMLALAILILLVFS